MNEQNDEISLKEFIERKRMVFIPASQWKIIVLAAIICRFLGLTYSFLKTGLYATYLLRWKMKIWRRIGKRISKFVRV
jgi:hypothetical protein